MRHILYKVCIYIYIYYTYIIGFYNDTHVYVNRTARASRSRFQTYNLHPQNIITHIFTHITQEHDYDEKRITLMPKQIRIIQPVARRTLAETKALWKQPFAASTNHTRKTQQKNNITTQSHSNTQIYANQRSVILNIKQTLHYAEHKSHLFFLPSSQIIHT